MIRVACLLLVAGCTTERDGAQPDSAGNSRDAFASRPACGSDAVLTGQGVGALRIGRTVEETRRDCLLIRDAVVTDNEGMPSRTLSVLIGADTITAEVNAGRVWRLSISTQAVRTADTLGVGTSLSRLLALPQARGMRGEGTLFVTSPRHCGLSFQLSNSAMDRAVSEWTAAALSRLPRNTRVTRVLVFGCESSANKPADSSLTVSVYGIGRLRAGMSLAEASAVTNGALAADRAGTKACDYVAWRGGPTGVSVMIENGRIARVDVDSGATATTVGARIGDTEARIASLYPGRVAITPHKYTEGHYLTVTPESSSDTGYRIVFETTGGRVVRYRAGLRPPVEYVERCG